MATIIKQGDAYRLPVQLTVDEEPVTESKLYGIETVEFYLADNLMEYKADGSGDVIFESGAFLLPLTQEMTFKLRSAPVPLDIRVKTIDGDVHGLQSKLPVNVAEARSRREL